MVLRGLGIGRKRGGGVSVPIDPPAGIDTTPNAFELGAPVQGEPDAILYSEEFTILGVTAAVAIPATLTGGRGDCRIERWNGSAWDNLGSTADLYLNNLCRLRTRAHTGADTFILTLTIGGVTDTLTVNTVVGLTAPAAPTATQLSAAGTNPMTISVNFGNNNLIPPDENDVAYDYIEHRHRVNGGAWVNETAKPVNMAFIGDHLVDGNPISWPLYNAATFTAGQVVGRMVGITRSPYATVWSNEVSDEIVGAVVEDASSWATSTGTNKSQYVTVNGTGNLVATGQSGFNSAPISVRSTQSRGGKRQFELVVGAKTDAVVHIGVDDGTDNLGDQGTTNFSRPGLSNSSGVTLKYPQFGDNFEIGVGGTAAQTAASAGSLANGDSLICVTDTVAGTVAFYVRRSGTITQVGSTVTGLSFTSYYANCGFENVETFTAIFGPGQNRTLDSGFVPFDNL